MIRGGFLSRALNLDGTSLPFNSFALNGLNLDISSSSISTVDLVLGLDDDISLDRRTKDGVPAATI